MEVFRRNVIFYVNQIVVKKIYGIKMRNVKIIAEIGCNHQGDINLAYDLISTAKNCGVDYVKFQKRFPEHCVPEHLRFSPHPSPHHSFGETYLKHRQALEFSLDQHIALFEFCQKNKVKYACSVWDVESTKQIISLNPDYIKVPSAANTNYNILSLLLSEFKNDIHISLGMMTLEEKQSLIDFLYPYKERIVVYWTTSEYPVPFERIYLQEIVELKKIFPRVGFSGHHKGISIDIGAVTLGIDYLERHFTLDRTFRGSDHAASLEPKGLQTLIRDINALSAALTVKDVEMTEIEKQIRLKLKIV